MTRIINRFLLLTVIYSTALSVVHAYFRDGADWNLFEEWLIDDKTKRNKNERTFDDSVAARSEDIYWNVRKAKGFVNQPAPVQPWKDDKNKDRKQCGLVFYYPAFWIKKRANEGALTIKSGVNKISDGDTQKTFERPLAMSPWCQPEPQGKNWPGWGNKDKKIVFHNYYKGAETTILDQYLIIEDGPIDQAPEDNIEGKVDTMRFEDFKSHKMWYGNASAVSDTPDSFNTRADGDYIYNLLKSYVDEHHDGTVPNPWKFGIDSDKWAAWTGVGDFWGYTPLGERIGPSPDGYMVCDGDDDKISIC